jgi:hypothetical protein
MPLITLDFGIIDTPNCYILPADGFPPGCNAPRTNQSEERICSLSRRFFTVKKRLCHCFTLPPLFFLDPSVVPSF